MKDRDWRDVSDFCHGYMVTVGDLAGCWPARERLRSGAVIRMWGRLATGCCDFLVQLAYRARGLQRRVSS